MLKTVISTFLAVLLLAATLFAADPPEKIKWLDYRQGMARGKQTGRTVMIYFYSDSCPSCTKMEQETWKDARVVAALNSRYTPVKVNVNTEREVAGLYKVYYLPTTWFIKPDGKSYGSRSGYIPAEMLLKILTYIPD